MIVKKLEIKNFRNIKNIVFTPDEKMNVICGPNAQGKTNLLEALWLFTGAKSFRGESEFIMFSENEAEIKLLFQREGVETEAKIEIKERKKAYLNENALASPGKLAGNFCAIIFSPQDIELIKDGPAVRRKFLDTAIFQIYPKYVDICKKYARAIAQRNATLKDLYYHPELASLLDVFDEEIIESGTKIIEYRKRYIDYLKKNRRLRFMEVFQTRENLTISYIPSASSEYFRELLKNARKEDSKTGTTSVGPHRDDIEFLINGVSARLYGSQGQKRSVALSLKLAEAEILRRHTGEETVALLDDVFSELDPFRQNYILNHIKDWQVFITCCDPSNIENLQKGKIFNMKNGELN